MCLSNDFNIPVTPLGLLCTDHLAPRPLPVPSGFKGIDLTDSLLVSFPKLTLSGPIPADDVPDEVLSPEVVEARALERYPTTSRVTPSGPTVRTVFTQSVQRDFRRQLDEIDPRISAKIDQPFGKENLSQTFTSDASLRHVLLPLWKSGFLAGSHDDWSSLCDAYYPARALHGLLEDYGDIEFEPVRGYNPLWGSETEVNQNRVAMATAAFLHFNGSVADLGRWLGGPHVGEHRDHHATLAKLKEHGVENSVIQNLRRIFLDGIPAWCNANASEENFTAYYRYGNHSTVDEVPEKTYKALVKDARKGFTLLLDERCVLLMLHCHLTPQGIVDLTGPKNPRPIFDSSFRPFPWCFAINDWTNKANEPDLTFATAELEFMIWLYNLRISYPDLEIYIADDDVSGAFRLMKYHPNCWAMHASRQCGYCVINTGGTFGDNSSPSNFDPIGLARRQLAQAIWRSSIDAVVLVRSYLPPLNLAPKPTPAEVAGFAVADSDEINTGVMDSDGKRKSPPYNMHVDDACYCDIGFYMIRTICVSILSLFWVLGFPSNSLVPSPLSTDKFEAFYDHERRLVGRQFNSRKLTVGILPYKLEILKATLLDWLTRTRFDLLGVAQLLGTLENHTKYVRWARCWYSALQNAVRRSLRTRFKIIARIYNKTGREIALGDLLPGPLLSRVHSLIAREQAQLLWKTKQKFVITPDMLDSIRHLLAYLTTDPHPWEVPLGLVIPRSPHFNSRGDASFLGGGAHCPQLKFWFDLAWSQRVITGCKRTKPTSPGFVHINSLEFIVVILQLAAIVTRLEWLDLHPECTLAYFAGGLPAIPVWLGETDNTVSCSWETRATARTSQGQGLVSVYAELLRRRDVHTRCKHLAGKLNDVADDISRNDFSLSYSDRTLKLFKVHPMLGTLDYFQTSPELIRLLTSKLFSRHTQEPCVLPTALGLFVPAGSTISTTVTL